MNIHTISIDPYTTTTATGVYSTAGDQTSGLESGLESSFTSPSAAAPYSGLIGSDGRPQQKELIERYLNKSNYHLQRGDPLTNQAISAANAAQAAAAAVAAAAAAAVTTSSNIPYGSTSIPPTSATLLNNALASTTAYGMSGLPATNAMLEDLIEGKTIFFTFLNLRCKEWPILYSFLRSINICYSSFYKSHFYACRKGTFT